MMTVICWDGETLAADRQANMSGFPYEATKIFRVPSGMVGFSGNGSHAMALLDWFKGDMFPANYPKESYEDGAGSMLITNEGELWVYDSKTAYPEIIKTKFFARGCGRDYALAAMYLGKSAIEAVEVASALDVNCGMGVDFLRLEASINP